ncbi:M48 family metalloprotease [Legionella gresilensis]|uniref:M48 family metalloprotease n=1 Tax=Legionella gresilensis TaxID=91823 RepID=UPI001040E141|nr:M48 family metalloprotease [Legionella gresilensis]
MYFFGLATKPLIRHILIGSGISVGAEALKSVCFNIKTEEDNKLIADPLSYEKPEFTHIKMIVNQALINSGFKGNVYVTFNSPHYMSISDFYSFKSNQKAAYVSISATLAKEFKAAEIYAMAGHEAIHTIHYHYLIGNIFCATSLHWTYHFIKQNTQDKIATLSSAGYTSRFLGQSLLKTLPTLLAWSGTYGAYKYILPQFKKLLEIDADMSSARLLGTKEEIVSTLTKFKDDSPESISTIIEANHPPLDTRIRLVSLVKENPNAHARMHQFFKSKEYLRSEQRTSLINKTYSPT